MARTRSMTRATTPKQVQRNKVEKVTQAKASPAKDALTEWLKQYPEHSINILRVLEG